MNMNDSENQIPQPSDISPHDANASDKSQGKSSSHVTAAPQDIPGQNYNPQLRTQYANEPHVVHANRAISPNKYTVSEEMQKMHDDSVSRYPHLNLSEGECVVLDIKRHPIGLFMPVFMTGLILLVFSIVLVVYPASGVTQTSVPLPSFGVIIIPALLLMTLVGIGGFIAVWVYMQNQFYLTNESVIQETQQGLFSRHEQTVSLGSVEDASYRQNGIFQMLFNYGSIRLSTEGEETTYRFSYVANPRKQIATLNNAIESFKNGRPVDLYEN